MLTLRAACLTYGDVMKKALIALALTLAAAGPAAMAQAPAGPIYAIVHVDLAPPPFPPGATVETQTRIRNETGARGIALVQEMAAGCTPQAGCLRFDVLQTIGAANHLTLVEVWRDQAAMDFFEGSERVKSARARLAPYLGSPFDQRLHLLVAK
jgi:quinol monooxygenase YgiN